MRLWARWAQSCVCTWHLHRKQIRFLIFLFFHEIMKWRAKKSRPRNGNECNLNKRCDSKGAKLKLSVWRVGRYRKGKGKSWTSRTEQQTSGRRACKICMRENKAKSKEFAKILNSASFSFVQLSSTRYAAMMFNSIRQTTVLGVELWKTFFFGFCT